MSSAFGTCLKIDNVPTNAFAIILNPIRAGWAVCLTDGRELARFRGPGARFRALRYLHAQLRRAGGRSGDNEGMSLGA